jgi:hypothetical protein
MSVWAICSPRLDVKRIIDPGGDVISSAEEKL